MHMFAYKQKTTPRTHIDTHITAPSNKHTVPSPRHTTTTTLITAPHNPSLSLSFLLYFPPQPPGVGKMCVSVLNGGGVRDEHVSAKVQWETLQAFSDTCSFFKKKMKNWGWEQCNDFPPRGGNTTEKEKVMRRAQQNMDQNEVLMKGINRLYVELFEWMIVINLSLCEWLPISLRACS